MRSLLGGMLFTATIILPSTAQAGLELSKIALHLKPHAPNACVTPPTVPCSQYTTAGRVGVSYDAYVVVADAGIYEGVGGLSCGIDYDSSPGVGVDVYSWTLCADGFEWPNSGANGIWPAAGGGNRMTWTTCQRHNITPHGIHAVAGVFYIYVYGADQLQIIENRNLDSGPELKVATCTGVETYLPAAYAGQADFTVGGVSPGYNPCNTPEPECVLPEVSIPLNYVPVGGYKDVAFTIAHGAGANPLHGTITETCPEFTIQSGGTYYLPGNTSKQVVQVRVAPTVPGPLDCLLHLGATCRDVRLTGTAVVTSHPLLSPASITQVVPNGMPASVPFQVQNIGSAPLEWGTRVEFGSLQDIVMDLDLHYSQFTGVIPGLVDGDVYGETGGNILFTDVDGATFNPGRGGSSFARSYRDVYVLVADLVGVDRLSVRGSLKQHTGLEVADRFTVHWNGIPYDVVAHRTFGNPDYPSLNHLFITADVGATFEYDPIVSSEDATLSGLQRTSRVFYLMYTSSDGRDINVEETTHIVQAFLNASHPYPQWAAVTSSLPVLSPGEVGTGELHLTTSGMVPGTYRGQVVISSNSLSSPVTILPVTLSCVFSPDIQVAAAIDFDSVFVGDTQQETLYVANVGREALTLTAQVSPSIFSLIDWDSYVFGEGSGRIIVECSPESLGAFSGMLTLLTNDPDEATVQIPLTGFAPPRPIMTVSPAFIVGTALPGGQAHRSIQVSNAGPGRLVFTAGSHVPWIFVSPPTGEVAPQASIDLDVLLDAGSLSDCDAESTLFLSSNAEQNYCEIPVTFHVAGMPATSIEVDPGTLNPASRGKWVNAFMELPAGDSPDEIVLETVRALGTVTMDPSGYLIGDANQNGIPDVHFRFDRNRFIEALPPQDRIEVLITGEIRNRHYFTARDSIRVLRPHVLYPKGGEALLAGAFLDTRFGLEETADADSIVVSYSPNGGVTWQAVGMTQGNNHLAWRLPEEPSLEGLIAVRAYRSGVLLGHDRSDAVFTISRATGIEPPPSEITGMALFQNFPNPFSTMTRIPFSLAAAEDGRIEIFNVAGMRVRTLSQGQLPAGAQEVSWDGKDDTGGRVPPGLYVVRLRTVSKEASRRMFLVP